MTTSWLLNGDYDSTGEVDLAGFTGTMATYGTGVLGLLLLARASGRELPERYSVQDLLIGGVATHKLSRILSKASVTSPLRSPFTEFQGPAGSAEHEETARGSHGVRHTIGELLTCPFCLGVWVGTGYVAGLALAPRHARAGAGVLAVVALSDALQQAYARLRAD